MKFEEEFPKLTALGYEWGALVPTDVVEQTQLSKQRVREAIEKRLRDDWGPSDETKVWIRADIPLKELNL